MEAQLRQNIFWHLYTGDKSAAQLNDRPFTLHEFNIRTKISLPHSPPDGHSLLDIKTGHNADPFEGQLMTGFHKCQELWRLAFDLLLSLQVFQPSGLNPQSRIPTTEEKSEITELYLQYMGILDDLPAWLRSPGISEIHMNEDQKYQNRCFWVQRVNLQVTYHCLRLIILQKISDLGLSSLLGITDEPLMLAFRKTEIARDMINFIQEVPFESLQVNGESCVLNPSLHFPHSVTPNYMLLFVC